MIFIFCLSVWNRFFFRAYNDPNARLDVACISYQDYFLCFLQAHALLRKPGSRSARTYRFEPLRFRCSTAYKLKNNAGVGCEPNARRPFCGGPGALFPLRAVCADRHLPFLRHRAYARLEGQKIGMMGIKI